MTDAEAQVEVFGIRHHGPGSARSLVTALDAFAPDMVLVEGPADADPLIPWAASIRTVPPVALLAYVADQSSRAAFWPFAVFSPEWQAIRWAAMHDVAAAFCDLPASISLVGGETREPPLLLEDPDQSDQPEPDAPESFSKGRRAAVRTDPLARLAAAAGYDDPERWWDDVVESRRDGASPFPALMRRDGRTAPRPTRGRIRRRRGERPGGRRSCGRPSGPPSRPAGGEWPWSVGPGTHPH